MTSLQIADAGANTDADTNVDVDVVVVGAGFAGMYLHYRLRELGITSQGFETGGDVGGTWYWNRYPGARCDVESIDYSYSFDPELEREWEWSEKYATQPEILRYANHVADKHDLRRHIQFNTRVRSARWDDAVALWRLSIEDSEDPQGTTKEVACRFYVMATGCLSVPKLPPDIAGVDDFDGEVFYTGRWPHERVDFTGKRVAVIGTGSSGIQVIPPVAAEASELTVFQRTPNFTLPAVNGPNRPEKLADFQADPAAYREAARWSGVGIVTEQATVGCWQIDDPELNRRLDEVWGRGSLLGLGSAVSNYRVNEECNERVAEFIRSKIRDTVDDPATAETLCPTDYPVGTKRICLETDYFATFNLDHVSLVDLKAEPITAVTKTGLATSANSYEFDVLILATGFDAMTGPLVAVDVEGRDGLTLKEKWADGPLTYLGLTVRGFPNFFTITGPGSPSVLSNMMVSIEQHVEWVTNAVVDLGRQGFDVIEPTETAEAGWLQHTNDCADITLYSKADSWYMGANVPGKPRVLLPYIGGVGSYRRICDKVVDEGYLGFELRSASAAKTQGNDGWVARLQPDVSVLLHTVSELGLPPIESMTPSKARAFVEASSAGRPPGPEVGEIVDGVFPGADGDLAYRLFRPSTEGPHPVVLYYHGGGWVLGSESSNDPLCRDLCVQSDCVVVSVDYRHGPEHRFPAAIDDAWAAYRWVLDNVALLGGRPGPIVLAGWSAGANLATVVAQLARDNGDNGVDGGQSILGQVLLNPVVDTDVTRPSYTENGEGYALTLGMMQWFWDHYTGSDLGSVSDDPRAAPIKGNLAGLPPALVVTAEFDPLRDEGRAYVEALTLAGVDARELPMRGHIHTSITLVDLIISSAPVRAEVAAAIRAFQSR